MSSQPTFETGEAVSQVARSFALADRDAILLRRDLDSRRHTAVASTCGCITLMAAAAVVLRNAAPQVLCPVAVFLMLLYFDHLRRSPLVFRLVSTRLLAETLRVMQAAGSHPQLLRDVVDWRALSTHPIAEAAARAARMPASAPESKDEDHWAEWLRGQQVYYRAAHRREQEKAWRARLLFNCAFTFVGLIALVAGGWAAVDASATATDTFRFLLAMASAVGSVALAFSNLVREQKAFEQSFDYGHLSDLFARLGEGAAEPARDTVHRTLLRASLDEHARWALRVAGHFTTPPPEIATRRES